MNSKRRLPRLCVTCAHCRFSPFEHGYSSLTPGADIQMQCGLPLTKTDKAGRKRRVKYARWDIQEAVTLADVRQMLLTAETCPDYVLYYEEPSDAS